MEDFYKIVKKYKQTQYSSSESDKENDENNTRTRPKRKKLKTSFKSSEIESMQKERLFITRCKVKNLCVRTNVPIEVGFLPYCLFFFYLLC